MRALSSRTGQSLLLIALLTGCGESEAPDDDLSAIHAPEIVRIVSADEALAGAQISKLDPATMNDVELRKAVGMEPRCEFRYTNAGRPVLAASMQPNQAPTGGILKLNGNMIALSPAPPEGSSESSGTVLLVAGPIRIAMTPHGEPEEDRDGVLHREADMVLEIGQSLKVGYRGYMDCTSRPPIRSKRH